MRRAKWSQFLSKNTHELNTLRHCSRMTSLTWQNNDSFKNIVTLPVASQEEAVDRATKRVYHGKAVSFFAGTTKKYLSPAYEKRRNSTRISPRKLIRMTISVNQISTNTVFKAKFCCEHHVIRKLLLLAMRLALIGVGTFPCSFLR